MLDLNELKKLHDKAYNANQTTREQAADDLVFYWVTQWDDGLLNDSQLRYRGEFNILRKAGRQIISDLKLNPVQPDFKPKNQSRDDDAELIDGLYRADDRRLDSQEAYDYAIQDQIVCGFGAWELHTEYATNQMGDDDQVIRRRFIPEANNTVFYDPNSQKIDKADADYCSILYRYSKDGYEKLATELTGEDYTGKAPQSFSNPEESYAFPWIIEGEKYYVTTFYHREKVKDEIYFFVDQMGIEVAFRESQVEDELEELLDDGYELVSTKKIERWEVTKYIASGDQIFTTEVVPGENIPVIPCYGERAIVEGEEYWEGITRLAKDPQRLRNFQMSYLADIVSRSPRVKPIFMSEQIQGFEAMYEETGADNNYPYYLQNRLDANGNPLPAGPVGIMPEQPIPSALMASMELSRQAVEDVANPGIPQDIADPDLSGKAIIALQNRLDNQSYNYQHNFKIAKRRDAEVYAGMATQIHDTPKVITIETPDGNTQKIELMRAVQDKETGELIYLNDLTNMEFDVYAEIGQSYQTQKQQTREELAEMAAQLDPSDPMRRIVMLKQTELMDGIATDDLRDYARKELLLLGLKEPETEEEMAFIQQAQGNQEPDAMTIAAMAEDKKADALLMRSQASIMKEQRETIKGRSDMANDRAGTEIDMFEAQTDRMNTQINAQEAQAKIDYSRIDALDKAASAELKRVQSAKTATDIYRGTI